MLEDFLTNLKDGSSQKKISVFCGAGISFDSGLPLAKELLRKICSALDLKKEETKCLLNSNLPFESFIETIHQEVSIDGILDVFELGVQNPVKLTPASRRKLTPSGRSKLTPASRSKLTPLEEYFLGME